MLSFRLYFSLLVIILIVCDVQNIAAQNLPTHFGVPPEDAKDFSGYLIKQKKYKDAIYVLKNILTGNTDAMLNRDSLLYLEAYSFLKLNQPDSAKKYFVSLIHSTDSSLREISTAFYNHINLLNLDSVLKCDTPANAKYREINRIHSLAFLLLTHNFSDFKEKFDTEEKCKITELAAIEFNLFLSYYEMLHLRKKNKFIAGMLSAILPGTGKWYAGKRHEAVLSFLPVALNGGQAAEGYYHQHLQSPHLYAFGTIGLVFYSSNIYGSAKSAQITNEERYEKIRLKIFADLDSIIAKL